MIMERIEEFSQNGKNFIYFDLSKIQDNSEIEALIESAKEIASKYLHNSLYTITNLAELTFDTKTKEITSAWMAFNQPYVICGAVIGLDGVRKIMFRSVLKLSGRTNMKLFSSKQQAIDWFATL